MNSATGRLRRDLLGVVVCVAAITAVAGCGESDATTSASVPATQVATALPTTDPSTDGSATTVAAPAPGTAPATEPPPAVSETAPDTSPATTSTAVEQSSGGYEAAATSLVPRFDGKSDPIVDPLPDGTYWSWEYASDGDTVSFTLVQYFFGEACREQFGDGEDACLSDNDTLYDPGATVALSADATSASVIMEDAGGGFGEYRVSVDEFIGLVAGRTPAADAPAGYAFIPYAVVVTVQNGRAVAANQVFTS